MFSGPVRWRHRRLGDSLLAVVGVRLEVELLNYPAQESQPFGKSYGVAATKPLEPRKMVSLSG
jgi:hypothetical protein